MTDENKQLFKWIPARDGTFHEIYSNFMHASWTLFDVRVRLGQLITIPQVSDDPKDLVVEERGAVTISWPQAKYIAGILAQLVESYEKTNGEIKPLKLPPDPTAITKAEAS